jgi:hypothetical protein
MNWRITTCALAVMAVSLGGCVVQSVHPFFTGEAVAPMSALNGRWAALDSEGKPVKQQPWVFGDNTLTAFDENGRTAALEVVYFKVGDRIFVDSTAKDAEASGVSGWWSFHVRAMHCLSRMETNATELVFKPLNYDWLAKAAADKRVSLPYVKPAGKDDLLIFTASSGQWMEFLREHGADDEVFPDKGKLTFRRVGSI